MVLSLVPMNSVHLAQFVICLFFGTASILMGRYISKEGQRRTAAEAKVSRIGGTGAVLLGVILIVLGVIALMH